MVGCVLDWVVLHTIKDGDVMPSGEQTVSDFNVAYWVRYPFKALKKQPTFTKILDVGAYDVNGSFKNYDFFGRGQRWLDLVKGKITGIDLASGPGVDEVMNAHDMSFKDGSFDLVLCLEMLEHDDDPAASIEEIFRVLKPGQPVILTCPDDHSPEHHQGVSDHYSFISKDGLLEWLKAAGFKNIEYASTQKGGHHLVYAVKGKQ